MEIFQQFAGVICDALLFIFLHAVVSVHKILDLVNDTVKLHVQMLFKLRVYLVQSYRRQISVGQRVTGYFWCVKNHHWHF